ncbi:MAG: hypothetical protein U1E76_16595 [Planctomycetota bacterium]
MTSLLCALLVMQASPLEPLLQVGAKMDASASEFLKGASAAAAFKAWTVKEDARQTSDLRDALKAAGVTRLSHMGFEFSLVFVKAERSVGWLRTIVAMDREQVGFADFRYEPLNAQARGLPLRELDGAFAEAARAVIAAIKSRNEAAIPFADAERIATRVACEEYASTNRWSIEQSRKRFAQTCATVAALDHDELRVRLDEVAFLAIAADGTTRGVLEANFDIAQGKYVMRLDRWRPFKKDSR